MIYIVLGEGGYENYVLFPQFRTFFFVVYGFPLPLKAVSFILQFLFPLDPLKHGRRKIY